ncbi:unnamed protein product [Paramecium sonneborni]|uniref:Uncharacterized protein n=1 Tax=Paramecium sonneborni TaxID=65129 RepID=A0A8S1LBL3_9CILI|nr:unnamed protein product [Paramecium sonneborni]
MEKFLALIKQNNQKHGTQTIYWQVIIAYDSSALISNISYKLKSKGKSSYVFAYQIIQFKLQFQKDKQIERMVNIIIIEILIYIVS